MLPAMIASLYDCGARARAGNEERPEPSGCSAFKRNRRETLGKKGRAPAIEHHESHVELASPDGCRREVREQLLDRWGQSRPLYRRSPRCGDATAFT